MTAEQFLLSVTSLNEQLGKLVRLQVLLAHEDESLSRAEYEARAGELKEQIDRAYEDIGMARKRVHHFIDRLPDEEERQLLKLLYLSLIRMVDAADVMGYSLRQCYRIKRRGLLHLEAMLY